MPPNAQAGDSRKSHFSHQLLACHTVSCVIGGFRLALVGTTDQSVRWAANAASTAVQNVGVNRCANVLVAQEFLYSTDVVVSNAKCLDQKGEVQSVNPTSRSSRFVFVREVGRMASLNCSRCQRPLSVTASWPARRGAVSNQLGKVRFVRRPRMRRALGHQTGESDRDSSSGHSMDRGAPSIPFILSLSKDPAADSQDNLLQP